MLNEYPEMNQVRSKIEYIHIEGYENFDLDCKKCVNGFSENNAKNCTYCNENQYLNLESVRISLPIIRNLVKTVQKIRFPFRTQKVEIHAL